jgi:hypothetical protein
MIVDVKGQVMAIFAPRPKATGHNKQEAAKRLYLCVCVYHRYKQSDRVFG